jgi:hypothetical protein
MAHRSRILTSIGILTLLFAVPAVSRADSVLFTNFAAGSSFNTGIGNVVGFDNNYAQGDTFTPTASADLSSLDIALSCFSACPDNFRVSLDANKSGTPGAALESFSVSGASLRVFGNNNPPLVLNSVLIPLLTAGTEYWVTVSSDPNDSIAWNLNSTGDTSSEAISTDGGTTWFAPSGLTPGAYQVNGTTLVSSVPEPSTLSLMLLALGLVLVMRKRIAQGLQQAR